MFSDTSKPTTPLEWKEKGNVFFREKKPADALICYQKALELDPRFKESFFNMGLCQLELNCPLEAHLAFTSAIEIDPTYAKAVNRKVQLLLSINEKNLAIIALDRYLANTSDTLVDPALTEQRTRIGLAYAKELTGQDKIKTPAALIAKGKEYIATKNYHLANKYFDAALAIDSKLFEALRQKIAIASFIGLIPTKIISELTAGISPEEERDMVAAALAAISTSAACKP